MINTLILCCCMFLIGCAGATKKDNAADTLSQKMDAFLTGLVQNNHFSGSVLVMKDGEEILKKGYGLADRENKIPYTPETISTVGSVTKQFTGTAILKLEMMGKLTVQDELEKYFPGAPADKKKITLHQLLTHTAGLKPAIGDDYEPLTRDAFMERAMATPLNTAPGERYDYSNVGYSILAAVVELTGGMGYEQFLHKYLFEPAGMKHTGYVIPDWKGQTLATGYRGKERWGRSNEKPWAADGPYWNLKGNGGILSNTADMYRWHEALLTDKILDTASKAKLYGRHVQEGPGAETFYGYGWAIFPTRRKTWLVTHNGGNGIYFCDVLRFLDEQLVIIYQTNAAQRGLGDLAFLLARMVFNPDFVPGIKPAAAMQEFKTMAGSPQGKLLEELTAVMIKGDEEALKKFISENFSARFRDAVPLTERLPRLKRIGSRIKDASVEKLLYDGEKTDIHFKTPEGMLIFGVLVTDGKISGIMVQE
ncbi:MAG: beta-lactamase family protein [Chitinophagaceae bacterium]|nr:beta-lactamase family protein [Chitinophagaceae bacterium]